MYAQVCASKAIIVPPYNADEMINKRLSNALAHGSGKEVRRLVSLWDLSEKEDWEQTHTEEMMVFGALLAGGTGRRGKQTMIDFFLVRLFSPFELSL